MKSGKKERRPTLEEVSRTDPVFEDALYTAAQSWARLHPSATEDDRLLVAARVEVLLMDGRLSR